MESVWELVGDPSRYPEWAADVVAVTGLAEVAEHETYEQVSRTPLGNETTTFEIEKLDDLHEIKLRCQKSGYYSHWVLTPAQEATFAEVEIGVEPVAPQYRLYFGILGKRSCAGSPSRRSTASTACSTAPSGERRARPGSREAGSAPCSARKRPMTPPRDGDRH